MKIKSTTTHFLLACFILTFQIVGMRCPPRAIYILPGVRMHPIPSKIHKAPLALFAHHSQSTAKPDRSTENYKENSHPKDYLSYLPDDSLVKNELKNCKKWLIPLWKSKRRKASDHIMETLEAHDKEQKVRFDNNGVSNILAFISLGLNSSMMERSIRTILKDKDASDDVIRKEKTYISSACYKIEEARKQQLEQGKKDRTEKAKTKL